MTRIALLVLFLSVSSVPAHAFEMSCFFPQSAGGLRFRFEWNPRIGQGQGILELAGKTFPVVMKAVESVWWGLGEEVLYTRAKFQLAGGATGELRAFPPGSEPDDLVVEIQGKRHSARAMQACAGTLD